MQIESVKLDNFKKDVFEEVHEKTSEIEKKVEDKLKKEYEEFELQCLEEAYDCIQFGLKDIDREKSEIISKALMENKVNLLNTRNLIIDSIVAKAKENIIKYTKTKEYKNKLILKINQNMRLMGEGKYKIYISFTDKDLFEDLKKEFSDSEIVYENKHVDMIGGHKLLNMTTSLFADDSYATIIEEEKKNILQYVDLPIEEEKVEEIARETVIDERVLEKKAAGER